MSDESVTIKARTYAFFLLSLMVDKTNAAWKDVKIPAGNFPKGFEQCEALTIDQIVQILQVTIKKKLQDIVDGNTGGETGHPPIECANAAASFIFHTDLGILSVQASVNGGPWKSINDQPALENTHQPSTYGGLYTVALSEGLPATRVQIKMSSPVAFYFNPPNSIDDGEQENQSYGLYDAADKFVNPFLPENWVPNSPYINDTSTDQDYCVMFSAADFCLKHPSQISCVGAINTVSFSVKMDRSEYNSTFTISDATTGEIITQCFGYYYMDGEDFKSQLHLSDEWLSRVEIVSTAPTEYPTEEYSLTGHIQIRVLDGNPLRIKVDATSPYGEHPERTKLLVESPINSTLVWNTQDEVLGTYNASVCLQGTSAPLGCEGAINTYKAQYITNGGLYEMYVNGVLFEGTHWMYRDDVMKNHLATFGVILNAYNDYGDPVSMGPDGKYEGANLGEFINTSDQYVQLKIVIIDASTIDIPWVPINKTATWDNDTYSLTVCLAPQGEEAVDAHCYNVLPSDIANLDSGGQDHIFLNNASGNYGLQVFSPAQFYITANGNPVNVYEGGGGAQWGTDTDPNISITDADGYLQFRNKTSSEMIIRICSRTPIPVDNRPIYVAVLGSDGNNMIVRTDDDGYQTCIIKLSPAG